MTATASSDLACRTCGACCAHAREWPRFTLESDQALARIPARMIDDGGHGMRCDGERCAALVGVVGGQVACAIYAERPDVCRDCLPGDVACTIARAGIGLAAVQVG